MKPFTVEEFDRLANLGPECVAPVAVRCALRGDRESIRAWMQWGAGHPDEPISGGNAYGLQALNLRVTTDASSGHKSDHKLTIMPVWIAALALRRDPGVDDDMLDSEILKEVVDFDGDQPWRVSWTEADEAVVREGVRLWRDNAIGLGQFFVALSRFVQHDGFVKTFVDEGVDIDAMLAHQQRTALGSNDSGVDKYAMTFMLRTGNFPGLARVLEALDPPSNSIHVGVLRQMAHDDRSLAAQSVRDVFKHDELDGVMQPHQLGPRSQGVLDTLNVLARWEGAAPESPDTHVAGLWLVRLQALRQCLVAAHENGIDPHPLLVKRLLEDQSGPGGSLVHELQHAPVGERGAARECAKLFDIAATMHQADLVKMAPRWITNGFKSTLEWAEALRPESLLHACALVSRHKGSRVDVKALRETLDVISGMGIDVTKPFKQRIYTRDNKGEDRRTSFLHLVAQSGHPDAEKVLLMALEMGFNTDERDARNRSVAGSIADQEARARWLAVEKSFKARAAATNALESVLLTSPGRS